MIDTVIGKLAETTLILLNWIAALLVLALTCPQYEHIAGLIAFFLAVVALSCVCFIAVLSETEEA